MEDKLLNLTPKKIINNLKRIEQALKRKEWTIYTPKIIHTIAPLNNDILNAETKYMLDFVGLDKYETDVKFCTTNNGIAGYIESANNTTEKRVHIKISDKYKSRWECCIAILAHEICHKLLAVNGLYEKDSESNETLVDLATIYVGFGSLILNGYISESKNQIIGYLEFDNYKVAHHIVSVVYRKESLKSTGLAEIDFLIDNVLEYWEKADSEYDLMKKCFIESEYQIAELHRNLTLLSQITTLCRNEITQRFAKNDNIFFKVLIENHGQYNNKLTALSVLYDMVSSDNFPKHKEDSFLKKVNDSLTSFIYDMLFQYQSKYGLDLNYDFECPHCGTKMRNNGKVIDRNAILKCSHCGCHYYYFGEKINFSKRQRELKEKRENDNKIIEERVLKRLQELRVKDEARVAGAKKNAERLVNISNQLVLKTKKEAEEKIAEIRQKEQNEYKQKVRERIPSYLRWILEKYL